MATGDQIAEFWEVFSVMDKNSNGFITSEIQFFNENPINEEDEDMISKQDFEDFLKIMSRKMTDMAEELEEAFKVFDRDQDGYISPHEVQLRHVMINLGERLNDEELEQMIREADLDGDGVISYEEFVRVMMLTT